jgi:sugar/nucleoside kinase (ribokinase family)
MTDRYAVVIGEALVDLLEGELAGELVYRPAIGGAPLNVAVGLARLGAPVRFVGSVGHDVWGRRIREFLRLSGVDDGGLIEAAVPTTLAVATFSGSEPDFHFYGEPASYGLLRADDVDLPGVAGASALYCGSIALMYDAVLDAARQAWAVPGPARAFDPNVRLRLHPDPRELRSLLEEFATTADLVKLSAADAVAVYPELDLRAIAGRLVDVGAGAVVVTRGAAGALVVSGEGDQMVAASKARAVDATGAGDATMAGLLYGILTNGLPANLDAWAAATRFAMTVATLVVESPGGATSMPTLDRVNQRLAQLDPPNT